MTPVRMAQEVWLSGSLATGQLRRSHVPARVARLDDLGRTGRAATALGDGAACVGIDADLRDAFFATAAGQAAPAKRLCGVCPVRVACLLGAIARDEQWGVWGGRLFRPRIVKVWVHRRSADTDGQWQVCVVDADGRRRRWGRFATQDQAQDAADRWAARRDEFTPTSQPSPPSPPSQSATLGGAAA